MSVIQRSLKLDGVLTDPTTVKLSDPDGTYGIKRNDNDAVVVADGTAMTKVSQGIYRHEFSDPANDLEYTAYIEIVYSGETYWIPVVFAGPLTDAPSSLEVQYGGLVHIVADFLAVGRDPSGTDLTRVQEIIDSGYRQYLRPPPLKAAAAPHLWSFLSNQATITLRTHKESGASADITGTTLTDSGGEFLSYGALAAETVQLDKGGDGTYEESGTVASITSETVLELAAGPAGGDGAYDYYIDAPAWQYPLPSDFGSIVGDFTYAPHESYRHVRVGGEGNIRTLRQTQTGAADPRWAAIRVKNFVSTTGARWEVVFHPPPSANDTLTYRYNLRRDPLRSATPYPLGGESFAELLIESCLAIAELRGDDEVSIHHAKFMGLLASGVQADLQNAPKYLGQMSSGEPSKVPLPRWSGLDV